MGSVEKWVEACREENRKVAWIPFRLLAALALYLAALTWHPKGKYSQAKAMLAAAMSHITLAAKEASLDIKASPRTYTSRSS